MSPPDLDSAYRSDVPQMMQSCLAYRDLAWLDFWTENIACPSERMISVWRIWVCLSCTGLTLSLSLALSLLRVPTLPTCTCTYMYTHTTLAICRLQNNVLSVSTVH